MFSTAEIDEARRLVRWIEAGGCVASFAPAEAAAALRLIDCAVAENMIEHLEAEAHLAKARGVIAAAKGGQ